MQVAVLTFNGFNELDSFVSAAMLNHVKSQGVNAWITSPTASVTSMNGLVVNAQKPLSFATQADAVIIGSGIHTRTIVQDTAIIESLTLDPQRQIIASQCSGALVLAKLGFLQNLPACTDLTSRPFVQEQGIQVLDQPFFVSGNIASAGGCMASQYLAAWLICKALGPEAARDTVEYIAPVGHKRAYTEQIMSVVETFL